MNKIKDYEWILWTVVGVGLMIGGIRSAIWFNDVKEYMIAWLSVVAVAIGMLMIYVGACKW
jgi:hypothetical protein